ncbi:MAG: Gfo/Idh/MocA family oxidoreductase [Planctomycetes bacterium]|nr:Gfo/Idh/MocA family oxidoreductase [Planctomycetota bacterium]
MTRPLGLGIVGLHHQHARWYHPLWSHLDAYRPIAVAEADEAFLAEEKAFFGLQTTTDYHALLKRDDIDVVILWLPHSRMPQAVADAAAAGKHVIVEKPCCADVAGAEAIVETARRHPKIKISSPYCWRTHPVTAEIRKAVDAGLLGTITAMEGRLNAGGAWRYVRDKQLWMLEAGEGGGPMWNLGVHWIDYFRWMTGREVVRVSGVVNGPVGDPPRRIEDNAQALLTFDGGATAILDISYSLPASYPGARDIAVTLRGTRGDAVWAPAWEGVTDELLLVSEHESVPQADRCRRLRIDSRAIPGYCGHMAWAWLNDFADAVRKDRPPLVSVNDILQAVRVADAFYRSVRSGKAEPVEG